MHPISKKLGLLLMVAAFVSGCSSTPIVALTPIEKQVPPLAAGVYGVKGVDLPPTPIIKSRVIYPRELRADKIEGKAVVLFTVRADGSVTDAFVVKSNDTRFGEAATAAILKWRFRPAEVAGTPVDCRMVAPFSFSIASSPNPGDTSPIDDPAGAIYSRVSP